MRPYLIRLLIAAGALGAVGFVWLLAHFALAGGVPLLTPSGSIGIAERDLMVRTVLLMLIVVVPVYLLIVIIAWRYRAGSRTASYTPDWEHSAMEEFIWWAIPLEIVLVLGAFTWSGTHALAPEKTIASSEQPEVVQVVALPWKWLFIYPKEGVATVNELTLPAGRPVTFEITADAPMNSFWIPALGGQMYAMTGMVTKLNLMAAKPGEFTGRSANYSGDGFAAMTFPVHARSEADWSAWVASVKASTTTLTATEYAALATPGTAGKESFGSIQMPFAAIVHAYMPEAKTSTGGMQMN